MGNRLTLSVVLSGTMLVAACDEAGFDLDLRDFGSGFDTTQAARAAVANRPQADNRGIISYPNYQVAIARQGDTVASVAERIGLGAGELARHNGLSPDLVLRANEVLALPRRVAEPSAATGSRITGPRSPDAIDITTLAGEAINRAAPSVPGHAMSAAQAEGVEPIRHKVEAGETAFTISRLYNVSVRSLAEWNGLGADLEVRQGQFLLIPVVIDPPEVEESVAAPGTGSVTPEPPSSSTALPSGSASATATPASPELGGASQSKFVMPVKGSIIRAFQKGKNDGIDIAAASGTSVVAAADGTIAAVTRDTDQVPIVVIRHADNILTVYAGLDNLTVKKGDKVTRGQKIGVVRDANPSFVHFEVRRGLDSVDPADFIS